MLGAITGDIAGSRFERNNIKTTDFELLNKRCSFTDDSVLTVAVADALMKIKNKGLDHDRAYKVMEDSIRTWALKYPHAGYGGRFIIWMHYGIGPYSSYGNGAPMRCSSAGWLAESEDEAKYLARISAEVTHNHPEGIKAAEVTAVCIYKALHGESKEGILKYAGGYYEIPDADELRKTYTFDVSSMGTMPAVFSAFKAGNNFEEVIRIAISLGGDSDTIGAIAGSIAEAYYGITEEIKKQVKEYLTDDLRNVVERFYEKKEVKRLSSRDNIGNDFYYELFKKVTEGRATEEEKRQLQFFYKINTHVDYERMFEIRYITKGDMRKRRLEQMGKMLCVYAAGRIIPMSRKVYTYLKKGMKI